MDTTRLQALKDLLAKVESDGDVYGFGAVGTPLLRGYAESAFYGSLDAAQKLHEALLPGWVVYQMGWWPCAPERLENPKARIELWQTHVDTQGEHWHGSGDLRAEGCYDTPARAWLLAILSALIAMEGE